MLSRSRYHRCCTLCCFKTMTIYTPPKSCTGPAGSLLKHVTTRRKLLTGDALPCDHIPDFWWWGAPAAGTRWWWEAASAPASAWTTACAAATASTSGWCCSSWALRGTASRAGGDRCRPTPRTLRECGSPCALDAAEAQPCLHQEFSVM